MMRNYDSHAADVLGSDGSTLNRHARTSGCADASAASRTQGEGSKQWLQTCIALSTVAFFSLNFSNCQN